MNLVRLYLYKAGCTEAFLDVSFPQEEDIVLRDVVERELKKKRPNTDIVIDRDLKSAKSGCGSDVTQLFDFPISNFFAIASDVTPKVLHVVFNPLPAPVRKKSAFDFLMVNAKTKRQYVEAEHSKEHVDNFIHDYHSAASKSKFLKTTQNKPSITQQHHSYAVQFCKDEKITYAGGSEVEEKKAMDGMTKLAKLNQFLTEYRGSLEIGNTIKYNSSVLLRMTQDCVRVKENQTRLPPVTVEMLMEKMKKADEALHAFPSSFYGKKKGRDERMAEPLLNEIELMRDIIGSTIKRLREQQERSKMNRNKETGTKPSLFNTETRVIKANRFKNDGSLTEAHLKLQDSMDSGDCYQVFHLTDDTMQIDEEKFPDARQRSRARKRFIEKLSFRFPMGLFIFKRTGSLCDWVAVCKLRCGSVAK